MMLFYSVVFVTALYFSHIDIHSQFPVVFLSVFIFEGFFAKAKACSPGGSPTQLLEPWSPPLLKLE